MMTIYSPLLAALALSALHPSALHTPPPPQTTPPAADQAPAKAGSIAEYAAKIPWQIEDDLSQRPDVMLASAQNEGECFTVLRGQTGDRVWRIDWRKIEVVAPVQNFVFIQGEGVKMALVGDFRADGAVEALNGLSAAMATRWRACTVPDED